MKITPQHVKRLFAWVSPDITLQNHKVCNTIIIKMTLAIDVDREDTLITALDKTYIA